MEFLVVLMMLAFVFGLGPLVVFFAALLWIGLILLG